MNIRIPVLVLALGGSAAIGRADIGLDDTYEQVIAEKGQPTGRASAGDSVILRYPDGSVRLKGGKVVAVNLKPGGETGARAAAATAAAPAPAAEHVPQGGAGLAWRTDYRAALTEAKAQQQHVFVFFTGSDWCGWCKRLNKEILSQAEFRDYANQNLILVEVDFPRFKELPSELKKQNDLLQRAFQIEGYPTVVVLNAKGKEIGRLGYQEGGPGPFVRALKKM
jgi:thiol-disulfide isomerase/thioredoxin